MTRVISNTYRGYTASIRYNEDDSVYIGSVEEISESFRGRTVDEVLEEAAVGPIYSDFMMSRKKSCRDYLKRKLCRKGLQR